MLKSKNLRNVDTNDVVIYDLGWSILLDADVVSGHLQFEGMESVESLT